MQFKNPCRMDGTSSQPKMSTNKQIKVRTQVLCKDLRYPVTFFLKKFGSIIFL